MIILYFFKLEIVQIYMSKIFFKIKGTITRVLHKYPKVSAIILSAFITTIFGFLIKVIFSYFSIKIYDLETPYLTLFFLFQGNCLRASLRFFFTSLFEKPLGMDIAGILNTPTPPPVPGPAPGAIPGAVAPAAGPVAPAAGPVAPVAYIVPDPTNIGGRGYIDVLTGLPYLTSQPYAGNLAVQMAVQANNHGNSTVGWSARGFDANATRFFEQYMQHNYPNRSRNQWWNSASIRKEFRNAG
jgi:hypothetical protein